MSRKDQILDALIVTFNEKGFKNVSHTSSPEVGGPEKDPDPENPRHNRRAEIHVRRG